MKKALLGILVVIIIGFIAAPFVNGLILEKELYGQLDTINSRYADLSFAPKFSITRYDRGFSSAEIEWVMEIPAMQDIEGTSQVIFVEKVKHGYLGASSTTSLNQNAWYRDFVDEELGGNDPLTITSEYQLFSGATVVVSVEPFELVDSEGLQFTVEPGKVVIKTDRSLQHFETDGLFAGFAIDDAVQIKNISLNANMNETSSVFMAGTSSFGVEQVTTNSPKHSSAMTLSNLKGTSTINMDESTRELSVKNETSLGQVVVDDETMTDLRFDIGMNHVDVDSFENFYKVYAEVLGQAMENFAAVQNNPEQAQAMMQQQMTLAGMRLVAEVEKLLQKDLQISIDKLHVNLPAGEIDGDIVIGLKKDMSMVDFIALSQQPQTIVDVFSFASNLTVPDGLIPNQDRLLVPVLPGMPGGVFEKSGEKLVHKAEIKDRKLLLNGKEFVLALQ